MVPDEAADMGLADYTATNFISGAPIGSLMSCTTMESWLHTKDKNDAQCSTIRMDIAETCQCPDEGGAMDSSGSGTTSDGGEDATTAPSSSITTGSASIIMALASVIMTLIVL